MESHECVTPDAKKCSKCGEVKPLEQFSRNKGKPGTVCKLCNARYHKEYYKKNAAKVIARTSAYNKQNAVEVAERQHLWYLKNAERVRVRGLEYRSKPEVAAREKARLANSYAERKEEIQAKRKARLDNNAEAQKALEEYQKAYYKANPHKFTAKVAIRRSRKLQATPIWADLKAIDAVYAVAAYMTEITGIKHEVDHIIPLVNKDVCGLHVANNLQVIPRFDNRSKANKFAG